MEFVNGKDDIPYIDIYIYILWKIKAMFETTNQIWSICDWPTSPCQPSLLRHMMLHQRLPQSISVQKGEKKAAKNEVAMGVPLV